jgi:predicted metalloprotease with PDZ domain
VVKTAALATALMMGGLAMAADSPKTAKPKPQKPLAPVGVVVRPLDLAQHELQVELTLPADAVKQGAVAAMAAWTPGSYLIRDYARFVDRVEARPEGGASYVPEKLDKQRWRILPAKGPVALRYRLYANELSVRTNHADATHAFLTGAAAFPALEGLGGRPYTIRFEGFPEDWSVATGLPGRDGAYHAADYDTLVDSPFELGRLRVRRWESSGARFEFVFQGQHNGDEARMAADAQRIVEEAGRIFGGFPFDRYVFLLTFSPKAGGGLEHRNSTALLSDPFLYDKAEGYHRLAGLVSHEFFHVWNVKRMRDAALGPFDYQREVPTRLLWFHEGFTDYMDSLIALRAGVLPWAYVAKEWGQRWTENLQRPGRREQSVSEASFDAWIRHYKPTEFSTNSTVGYYDKGSLVALMMEGRIRLGSGGKAGVADLFARLWKDCGDGPVGDAQIREAFRALSGEDPQAFWRDYVEGRAELDGTALEQALGLKFEAKAPWELLSPEDQKDPEAVKRAKAFTGLVFAARSNGADAPAVQNVLPDSPAWRAGISYGAEILAVDGWRTTSAAEVQRRLADAFGGGAEVLVQERGRVRTARVEVVENPARTVRLMADPSATAAQREAFTAWTGLPFPAALRPVTRGGDEGARPAERGPSPSGAK